MTTMYHWTVDLRWALRQPDLTLAYMLTPPDGTRLTADEAREVCVAALREGYDALPMCDAVDAQGRCQGHRREEP